MPRATALAFDFNGTLSRDESVLCGVYQELFAEHGRPLLEVEYYEQLCGLSEEAIIAGWLDVEGAELEGLVAERIRRYLERAADGSTITPATWPRDVRLPTTRRPARRTRMGATPRAIG